MSFVFLFFTQTLASEPCIAVVFSSSSLHNKPIPVTEGRTAAGNGSADSKGPAAKREKLSFTAYLKRILPPSCDIIGLTADGVVGKCRCTSQSSILHVLCEIHVIVIINSYDDKTVGGNTGAAGLIHFYLIYFL